MDYCNLKEVNSSDSTAIVIELLQRCYAREYRYYFTNNLNYIEDGQHK